MHLGEVAFLTTTPASIDLVLLIHLGEVAFSKTPPASIDPRTPQACFVNPHTARGCSFMTVRNRPSNMQSLRPDKSTDLDDLDAGQGDFQPRA